MYDLDITWTYIFSIDQEIIQVDNHENIEFYKKNFINIALKAYEHVR